MTFPQRKQHAHLQGWREHVGEDRLAGHGAVTREWRREGQIMPP